MVTNGIPGRQRKATKMESDCIDVKFLDLPLEISKM
jgi:hypothetical protein